MMTFSEWRSLREGLWLADKNAMPGMSRINPFPTTQCALEEDQGEAHQASDAAEDHEVMLIPYKP